MPPRALSVILLVGWSAMALAQQAPLTLSVDESGAFVVATGAAGVLPTNPLQKVTAAERERLEQLQRHVVPRLLAAAEAGAEPASWQVGFFFLFGWFGVPADVERGRRALAWAPPDQRAIVLWALALNSDEHGERLLAEEQVLAAFDAGLVSAPRLLCRLARDRSGLRRPRSDLVRAEQLVSRAWPHAKTNPSCNFALGVIRYHQHRFSEAFDAASVALSGLDAADEAGLRQMQGLRLQAGFRSGRFAEIPLEELTRIFQRPNASLWWKWTPWVVLVVSLLLLIAWTWARRAHAVGLMLASTWFSVAVTGNALGLLFPLPLPLGPSGSRWAGSLLTALACALAFRLRAPNGVFGNTARPIDRGLPRQLGASFIGATLFAGLYQSLWTFVFGEPQKDQLVIAFFRVSGALEVGWTFAVVAILIPYVEEVCFRGFLFEGLEARWGPRVAVIVSTLIFGFVHVEMVEPLSKVPMTTLIGFFVALLRLRSGDLRLSFARHGMNNALAFLIIWTS
jgi:membrane protease YdiL (CAAX protease family)